MREMVTGLFNRIKGQRTTSVVLSVLLSTPLFFGCGNRQASAPPPVDGTRTTATSGTSSNTVPEAKRHGLSNGQKAAVVLAGAAALYYLYNQHKHAQAQAGPNGQYYLSKNGRVYYRDAEHRAHWVTPPSEGIRVPADEAQQYQSFQGYNNRTTGRDLSSLPEAQAANY
jgi:hypothetical protein